MKSRNLSDDRIRPCHITSSTHFAEVKGKSFPAYYLPTKFYCHRFHALEVLSPFQAQEPKKKGRDEIELIQVGEETKPGTEKRYFHNLKRGSFTSWPALLPKKKL